MACLERGMREGVGFALVIESQFRLCEEMNWENPKPPAWFTARMIAWALYDMGATVFSMLVISRYFGPWVVEQMGGTVERFNDAVWKSLLIAALLQVILSPISDELGRRRIFVVLFTLLCVGCCILLGYADNLQTGIALFVAANVGYQVAFSYYNAMLGDVADERHWARISGIGIGIGYVGSVIGLLVAASFIHSEKGHVNYSPGFQVAGVLFLILSLPMFLFVKDKPGLVRLNLSQSLTNSVGSFITTLRRVLRNREMSFFFLGCLLALDAVSTVIVNMALYCEKVVGLDPSDGFKPVYMGRDLFNLTISQVDLFIISCTVFAIFGAFVIGHISDKTSHYKTLLAVLVIWMAGLILAMFGVQRRLFYIVGPLFGLGFGGIWTVSRAYLQELCHPEERSQMFALFGVVSRGAAIIGTFLWARVFAWAEPAFGERKAYRLAFAGVLILLALGFWMMRLGEPRRNRNFQY